MSCGRKRGKKGGEKGNPLFLLVSLKGGGQQVSGEQGKEVLSSPFSPDLQVWLSAEDGALGKIMRTANLKLFCLELGGFGLQIHLGN